VRLMRLVDAVLRDPSYETVSEYLGLLNGPVKELVNAILELPPVLSSIVASTTPAIRVPCAEEAEVEPLDYGPDIGHSPLCKIAIDTPKNKAAAGAMAGRRWGAFLRCSGANVFMVLFHCGNLIDKSKASAIPEWPGLYELAERPLDERRAFDTSVRVSAACFTLPDVVKDRGARRTYISTIVRGVRWLRHEYRSETADAECGEASLIQFDLQCLHEGIAEYLSVLDEVDAADGEYPAESVTAEYRSASTESARIHGHSKAALPTPPGWVDDPHIGLVELYTWCILAIRTAAHAPESGAKQADSIRGTDNSEGKTREKNDSLGRKRKPSPAISNAYAAYVRVCKEHPELVPDKGKRYTKEMHARARECSSAVVPRAFPTWTRYIREYELLTSGPKNAPRGGRSGRSVVSRADL